MRGRSNAIIRRCIRAVMRGGVAGAAAVSLLVNSYLVLLTVAAWSRKRSCPRAVTRETATHRIAVLIPAHDEAGNIGRTVDSALGQAHPAELRSVHVVADNCADATAAIARAHGAAVHERHDLVNPGKGPALRWLVDRVLDERPPYDGVVIIDADTTMAPDMLASADAALASQGSAWQGYYTVRDPQLSAGTALRHAALMLRHYVRPLGRTALGGSCGLFGNGMVFRPAVVRDRAFSAHLTEDVEFQLELLLDGELVGFLPEAVVAAEMPHNEAAARSQNERWERGRQNLARRFVPTLIARATQRGQHHRWALVDAALDQLTPPLSVLAAGSGAIATAAVLGGARPSAAQRVARAMAVSGLFGLVVHVLAGLRIAGAPRSIYVALLGAPRLIVWKVGLWLRVLVHQDDVTWRRTARNAG